MNIVKNLLKEALTEAYNAVDEIKDLTTDVILYFAKQNFPLIARLNRRGIHQNFIHFNNEYMGINPQMIDINKYKVLRSFINSGSCYIQFVTGINVNGSYGNGRIEINMNRKEFIENLTYTMGIADRHPDDNTISAEDAYRIIRVGIGVAFRSTLMHEIRHAYDDFISKSNYANDKKSLKYYKNKTDDPTAPNYTMSPEEHKIYLTLPHEYWARFTQTIHDINKSKPFNDFFNEFKRNIKGWDLLTQNNRERLGKAAYRYWDLKPAVNEISVKHKGQYNAGQEHIIYPARNKNMLIKVGPINIVDTWLPLFEKYPNIFPKVYKSGFTIKNGERFKYVVLEKLDTDKVQAQWDLINDALNEIGENDEDYLEYCFDDMAMTFLKSLLNPEYHTAISTMLQQFKPNEFESYMKWFNFISEVNKLVRQIKNVDAMDVYDGNFGYDSTGKIKCLDI